MIDLSQKRVSGPVIRLHPRDNVVVARVDMAAGAPVPEENVVARGKVPAGYKIATAHLRQGDPILKYNIVIGFAGERHPGRHDGPHPQHRVSRVRPRLCACQRVPAGRAGARARARDLQGHRARRTGASATRNFIGIISTVNCSATVVHEIADHFTPRAPGRIPQRRRRGRLRPRAGLRHGNDRRADGAPAPHARRLRASTPTWRACW